MTADQFKNLLTFLMIMTNEDAVCLLDKSPDYILEKWYRYVNAPLPTGEGWNWGMHPTLRAVFLRYCEKWHVDELFAKLNDEGE